MKVRQDAWSHEDDRLLATTVLRHIKEGSTQLQAFEEVGDLLNRTSAACGFRWNAVIRSRHEHDVAEAKRERKQRQRKHAKEASPFLRNQPVVNETKASTALSFDEVISFLQTMKEEQPAQQSELENALYSLQQENEQLKSKIQQMEQENLTVQKDYQTMLAILDRARNLSNNPSQIDSQEDTKLPINREGNVDLDPFKFLNDSHLSTSS